MVKHCNPDYTIGVVDSAAIKKKTKGKLTTYPVSHLSSVLSPFSHCLIHLINYKYLDLSSIRIPLVLERYPSQKHLWKLMRRQNDNFRWKCVFHGFLYPTMPKGSPPSSLFRYSAFYSEFWTGPVKEENIFSNIYRHRDYYVYFTNRKSSRNWLQFAQGVHETQRSAGQSHSAVVYMSKNSKFLEWHISCRTCHPAMFTFHQQPARVILIEEFSKIAATIHPDRIFQICDIYAQHAIPHRQKTRFPNFFTISTHSNIDITTFSAIYPNNSYVFEVMTFMTGSDFKEPRRTRIQINQATNIPIVRIASQSHRFLTCDGLLKEAESGPSFHHLVSAYQVAPWFTLVTLILLTNVVFKIIFSLSETNCNALLLMIAFLVEQGIGITPSTRKTLSALLLLAPWLLMSIIISNAYKGQNVTDLISPLKPRLVSLFDEILAQDYTLYVSNHKWYDHRSKKFVEREETSMVRSRLHISIAEYEIEKLSNDTLTFLEKLKSRIFVISDNHKLTLIDAISSCNKTAMVTYGSTIDEYESQLKFLRPNSHVVKSSEEFFKKERGWIVDYGMDPQLEARFSALFQAGCVNLWRRYIQFLRMIQFNSVNRASVRVRDDEKSGSSAGELEQLSSLQASPKSSDCLDFLVMQVIGKRNPLVAGFSGPRFPGTLFDKSYDSLEPKIFLPFFINWIKI
ncbi:hypothetical protein Fcan01_22881 [Folsomia candida]|uniref:Uncharacterized protein n=1 Tax=Folsomia candida TaxID=158441 RepID=A0A226DAR4_FOLCA|nr:hypothetical protein Fcan01_22881 [Folsomia candida]